MLAKELIASAYHTRTYLIDQTYHQRLVGIYQAYDKAQRGVKPNYSAVLDRLKKVQEAFIAYERTTGFPFDDNPLLAMLGIDHLMGPAAVEKLKDLVANSPAEAESMLQEAPKKTQIALELLKTLDTSLSKLPIYDSARHMYLVENADRVLMRFTLPSPGTDSLDRSAKDLEKLQVALQHIAKLHKDTKAYEFEVVALSQASPVAVLLAVTAKVAVVTNIILKTVLKRWKEIEEIRKLRAEVENLQADTEAKKLAKEQALAAFAELENQKDMAKVIADDLVKDHGTNLDGAPGEVEKAIKLSVKYLETLVNNGGTVNVYLLPEHTESAGSASVSQEWMATRSTQLQLDAIEKKLLGKKESA